MTDSPALTLLRHVWSHECKAVPFSWERVNWGMQDALRLAITAGLTFAKGDFVVLASKCRTTRWLDRQQAYACAIGASNASAYQAMECDWNLTPIIADDVKGDQHGHGYRFDRERERLAVGFSFAYRGLRPEVTSRRKDHVIACTYPDYVSTYEAEQEVLAAAIQWADACGYQAELSTAVKQLKEVQARGKQRRTPKRRFVIRPEDVIVDRADQRERELMHSWGGLWDATLAERFCAEVFGEHPRKREYFARLPRRKIDQALKKLGLKVEDLRAKRKPSKQTETTNATD